MDSLGIYSYLLKYSGGIFSNLGALPTPYKSSGDLFFYEHHLFLTSYSTSPNPLQNDDQFLVNIDMVAPSQSCIYMPLPSTPLGYWGAFSVWDGSQSQVFTQGNNGIQEIDMKCKVIAAATCTILSGGCRGFASWYPFTSSNSSSNCNTVAVSLITSTTQMCEGETATLTANGWSTYTWSVPGTQSTIAVAPSTTTTYTISGTNSTGCQTSMSVIIYVNSAPLVTISGQSTLCAGSAILLIAAGAQSYSWSTGGFTSTIYPSPQADTVFSVTGTGSNGCRAMTQFSVSVFDCVGIDEKSTTESSATVFPNPGRGPFQCISDAFIREAIIFDGLAREVKRINNCGNRITIEDLKPGIYFLLLSTEREALSIKFVVLE